MCVLIFLLLQQVTAAASQNKKYIVICQSSKLKYMNYVFYDGVFVISFHLSSDDSCLIEQLLIVHMTGAVFFYHNGLHFYNERCLYSVNH